MKLVSTLSILLMSVSACNSTHDTSAVKDSGSNHVTATNCEIFIDKIGAGIGSHASLSMSPYIKILKDRLDGAIEEVGFRNKKISTSHSPGSVPSVTDWRNEALISLSPVDDYWGYPYGLMVASSFNSTSYEGVFYVKTVRGTYYWAKPTSGNFIFAEDSVRQIYNNYPNGSYGVSADKAIPTQAIENMRQYNPSKCY